MSTLSLRAGLVAVLLSGGLLSGCGVTGTDFRPGVAAEVDDVRIDVKDVDTAVENACIVFADQRAAEDAPVPRAALREQLVQLLVQRAIVADLVEESGAELGPGFQQSIALIEQNTADLPAEQRDALILGNEAAAYVDAGLAAVGTAMLADGDATDPEAIFALGQEAFADWVGEHDVAINPVYGLGIVDGQVVPVDDDLSVATSPFAQQALADIQPLDPGAQAELDAYVATLPAAQLC